MDMKAMMTEQKEEMLRDKYIESEKAGHDLGEHRMVQWTKEHADEFRREYYRRHLMDIGDGTSPIYFGIFLDDSSKKLLIDMLLDGIPNDWTVYANHVKIVVGSPYEHPDIVDFLANNLGKRIDIDVVSLGITQDAIAVGVSGLFKSTYEQPYVLLATKASGDPDHPIAVKGWKSYELTTPLSGVVDAFPSHFRWKH